MPRGFETKKVIGGAGDAAMRPQAPVNHLDGAGSAFVVGRAEAGLEDTVAGPTGRRGHARMGIADLIDVAVTGVHPSTTAVRQTGRWFLT